MDASRFKELELINDDINKVFSDKALKSRYWKKTTVFKTKNVNGNDEYIKKPGGAITGKFEGFDETKTSVLFGQNRRNIAQNYSSIPS